MFIKDNILSINLAQYGQDAITPDEFLIELDNRQTDEPAYSLTTFPLSATNRLFTFDVSSLNISDGQYIAKISLDSTEITTFNVRTTNPEVKTSYETGLKDSVYENKE